MNDSNWKKMVGIVGSVCRKYRRAVVNTRARQEYHEDITAAAGAESVATWTAEIERAEARRMTNPKVMDLLGTRIDKRMFPSAGLYLNAILCLVP